MDELRLAAAKAARRVSQAARRDEDLRYAITQFVARYSTLSIFDVAENDPEAVILFADSVDTFTDDELPRWMA